LSAFFTAFTSFQRQSWMQWEALFGRALTIVVRRTGLAEFIPLLDDLNLLNEGGGNTYT